MYNRSVFLTCSVVALCVGLGMTSAWAMEKEEDVGHQSRVLPSRQIELMEQINNALTLPDRGVASLTALANDTKLGWGQRIKAAWHLPDRGKKIITSWMQPPFWAPPVDLTNLVKGACELPDQGVALLTAWACDKDLYWELCRLAALSLPDKGVTTFTALVNDNTLNFKMRIIAAVNLPDKGVARLKTWAYDKTLGWDFRIEAALNLPDRGQEILLDFVKNNDNDLDVEMCISAARNVFNNGEAIYTGWANDPKCHPRLRLEGIKRLNDRSLMIRVCREISSDVNISIGCRLTAWYLVRETSTTFLQKQMEPILNGILQKAKESIASFIDCIKTLPYDPQKELLEKMLKQKSLKEEDKEELQRALTVLNKSVGRSSMSGNNNNTSTSTSTSPSSSKGRSIGQLIKASLTQATPASQTAPTAQAPQQQDSVADSKQEEKVNPPIKSKEKKSKKKKKPSNQAVEKKSDEELKALEEKQKRLLEDEQKEQEAKKNARQQRHKEKKDARSQNNNNPDVSSEDETSTSTSSRTSTDDSSSDVENDAEIKAKRKEVKALIRRAAVREVVDAQKVGQMPNALEFVQRVLSQTMPSVAPVIAQKFVQTAHHALDKAKRVFGTSSNNNNPERMERDEEKSYTVKPVKAFKISLKPGAATDKYNAFVDALKKEGPFPSIGKVMELKDVKATVGTVEYPVYRAKLTKGDRLVYIVVEQEIKLLFAGDHKGYERYIAGNNIVLDDDEESEEEAEQHQRME